MLVKNHSRLYFPLLCEWVLRWIGDPLRQRLCVVDSRSFNGRWFLFLRMTWHFPPQFRTFRWPFDLSSSFDYRFVTVDFDNRKRSYLKRCFSGFRPCEGGFGCMCVDVWHADQERRLNFVFIVFFKSHPKPSARNQCGPNVEIPNCLLNWSHNKITQPMCPDND